MSGITGPKFTKFLHASSPLLMSGDNAVRSRTPEQSEGGHFTQPASWDSFYRPTEGRGLSRPSHCRKGAAARAQRCVSQCTGCRDKRTDGGLSHRHR